MITILEHGKMMEVRTAICDECGCKFSFTREDCYWDTPCLAYGELMIKCPECKHEIWLGNIYNK